MSPKKKSVKKTKQIFQANPFSDLRGFAASEPQKEQKESLSTLKDEVKQEGIHRSFDEEMTMMGVRRLEKDEESESDAAEQGTSSGCSEETSGEAGNDEDLFLEAMAGMNVAFKDEFDLEEKREAAPARMKQLRQGRIKPQATLDLHGVTKTEVIPKLEHFFRNSCHQKLKVLLVITGRGLHSQDGEAILRQEAERFLRSGMAKVVAEWGRAPREYGGSGALIVFLKSDR